jgi:hypothetical protein
MRAEKPSPGRLVGGCRAATASAPVPYAVLISLEEGPSAGLLIFVMGFGFVIAALHLLLAMPTYSLLRRRWPLTWWNAALGGFVVGALPTGALSLGWGALAWSGASGAMGGLVFWAVLRGGRDGQGFLDDLDRTFA